MNSTSTPSITSEDHPLLYNTDTQPKKKLNCCDVWNEFRNNSDLIAAMTILVIDIMFFVGIWFPNHIPKLVTSVSYTSLSFIGLLIYPFMLMSLSLTSLGLNKNTESPKRGKLVPTYVVSYPLC